MGVDIPHISRKGITSAKGPRNCAAPSQLGPYTVTMTNSLPAAIAMKSGKVTNVMSKSSRRKTSRRASWLSCNLAQAEKTIDWRFPYMTEDGVFTKLNAVVYRPTTEEGK